MTQVNTSNMVLLTLPKVSLSGQIHSYFSIIMYRKQRVVILLLPFKELLQVLDAYLGQMLWFWLDFILLFCGGAFKINSAFCTQELCSITDLFFPYRMCLSYVLHFEHMFLDAKTTPYLPLASFNLLGFCALTLCQGLPS